MNIFSKKLTALLEVLAITAMSLPMSVGAMAKKDTNLLVANHDPGFEAVEEITANTSYWNFSGGVSKSIISTDQAHAGSSKSVKVPSGSEKYEGPQAKLSGLTVGSQYYVSAWVYTSTAQKAQMALQGNTNATTNLVDLTENQWTQVSGMVTVPAATTGQDYEHRLYVMTIDKRSADIYVDDFEICAVTDITVAQEVAGNLFGNAGFETDEDNDDNVGWRNATGNAAYTRVNSIFDANTGSCAAKATGRSNNYTGPQQYVTVDPDTYYYVSAMVRQGSNPEKSLKAKMRVAKTGSSTTFNEGNTEEIGIYTDKYAKIKDVVYSGEETKLRVYVQTTDTTPFVDMWFDDFVMLPIAMTSGKTDVTPNSAVTLSVPEDIVVTKDMISIDKGAKVEGVTTNGRTVSVALSGMLTSMNYTLKLDTGLDAKCIPSWSFTTKANPDNILDVNGYDPSFDNAAIDGNKWNFSTSTCARSSEHAHSGAQSVKVTARQYSYSGPQAKNVPLVSGEKYTASAWVYTEAEGEKATVRFEGADGGAGAYEDLVPGEWTLITRTINVTAATAKVYVYTEGKSDIWVDDFAVSKYTPYKHNFSKDGTSITCEFANNVNSNNLMLAIAAYDSTGKLVYVDADVSTTTSGTLTVTAPTGAYEDVKVFLWDVKTFAPIVEVFSPDSI